MQNNENKQSNNQNSGTYTHMVIPNVLKTGSSGEPVRLLVHDSTGSTGSITGRTVLPCKYIYN